MDNIDLLRRAKGDLRTVVEKLANIQDEVDIDIAAYHLHQTVEKCIKYTLRRPVGGC